MQTAQAASPSLRQRLEKLFCCGEARANSRNEQQVSLPERIIADSHTVQVENAEQMVSSSREPATLRSTFVDESKVASTNLPAERDLQQSRSFYLTHQVEEVHEVAPAKLNCRRYLNSDKKPVDGRPVDVSASTRPVIESYVSRLQTPQQQRQTQVPTMTTSELTSRRYSIPKVTFTYQAPRKSYVERQSHIPQLPGALDTNPVSYKVAELFKAGDRQLANQPFSYAKSIVEDRSADRLLVPSTNLSPAQPIVQSFGNLNPELPYTTDFRDKFKLSEVVNLDAPADGVSITQTPKQQLGVTSPKDMLGSSQAIGFPSSASIR